MTIGYFNVSDDEFNLLAYFLVYFTLLYFNRPLIPTAVSSGEDEAIDLSIGFKLLSLKPLIQFF